MTTTVSADEAAAALGGMSNLLGLTGKDFERFASALVDLGNKGASTEDLETRHRRTDRRRWRDDRAIPPTDPRLLRCRGEYQAAAGSGGLIAPEVLP